jgi:hypothetical protein
MSSPLKFGVNATSPAEAVIVIENMSENMKV